MRKNILIYSLNSSPETTGVGRYTGQMVEYLRETDKYNITVVTATPYYPLWCCYPGFKNRYKRVKQLNYDEIRCPLYIPRNPSTIKRLFHLLSFSITSFLPLVSLITKNISCVLVIAPTLMVVPNALIFGKITGARTVLHIQDFELDAMFDINMRGPKNRLFNFATKVETFFLKRFDVVSTISHRMVTSLHYKGVPKNKTVFFPNWVNTDHMRPIADKALCRTEVGIDFQGSILLYSGNMGKKQGLDLLINAADQFKHDKSLMFILAGEGSEKNTLKNQVKSLGLKNVIFLNFVSEEKLPFLLNCADVHVVLQKSGVGDSVLPSKLGNIIATGGHAIVSAEENTEIYDLNEMHSGLFTLIPTDDKAELIEAIVECCGNNTNSMNFAGIRYADNYLNHHEVLRRYEHEVFK